MHVDAITEKESRWLEALKEFREALDSVDFPYFIDTGTLLGAVRDKKFIAWDNDIDFGSVRTPDTHEKLAAASQILYEAGFSYVRHDQGTYFVRSPDIELGIMFYEREGDNYVGEFRKLGFPFGPLSNLVYLTKAVTSGFIVDYNGHDLGKKARHLLMKIVGRRPFRPAKQYSPKLFDLQIKRIAIPARFFDNLTTVEFYGMSFPAPNPPAEYLTWRYGDWKTPVSEYNYFEEDRSILA